MRDHSRSVRRANLIRSRNIRWQSSRAALFSSSSPCLGNSIAVTMDSDPSQIPVVPIPFEHGLHRFERSLSRRQAKIVAIGSSTTAGEGNIRAYPERLRSFLQAEYPNAA